MPVRDPRELADVAQGEARTSQALGKARCSHRCLVLHKMLHQNAAFRDALDQTPAEDVARITEGLSLLCDLLTDV